MDHCFLNVPGVPQVLYLSAGKDYRMVWIGRDPFKGWGTTLPVMQPKAVSALLLPWEWLPGSVQGQQSEQD